jgi:uncharacterized membrane protein YecN with MAPEG domain
MNLPVTGLYTALFLLLMLALAANVVRLRIREGVSLGDGDNKQLRSAIRAHGNAAEYVPLVLIGMAALETLTATQTALYLYGSVFFIARVLHFAGLSQAKSVTKMRQGGIVLSWLVMLALSVHLLAVILTRGL